LFPQRRELRADVGGVDEMRLEEGAREGTSRWLSLEEAYWERCSRVYMYGAHHAESESTAAAAAQAAVTRGARRNPPLNRLAEYSISEGAEAAEGVSGVRHTDGGAVDAAAARRAMLRRQAAETTAATTAEATAAVGVHQTVTVASGEYWTTVHTAWGDAARAVQRAWRAVLSNRRAAELATLRANVVTPHPHPNPIPWSLYKPPRGVSD